MLSDGLHLPCDILDFRGGHLDFSCSQSALNWLQDEEVGRRSSNCSIYSTTTLSIPTGAR